MEPRTQSRTKQQKLIILDRDGVINEDSENYIRSVNQWIPIPGSIEAIARLSRAGFQVAVATNQSGLARGYFTMDDLKAMHDKMIHLVVEQGGQLSDIYFCPHGPDDHCRCRKPSPGMLEQILEQTEAEPSETWVVGDSLRDLEAGQSARCKTALVLTGKGGITQSILNEKRQCGNVTGVGNTPVFENLAHFTEELLSEGI